MVVEDPRLAEARAKNLHEVAAALGIAGLGRASHEWIGPCPRCGGHDRFAINPRKGVWQCRKGCGKGDAVALVRLVRGVSFLEALDWLCGPLEAVSAAERAQRERTAQAALERVEAVAARYRERAVAEARAIWQASRPAEGTPVRAYLARRGLTPARLPQLPAALRFHPALPYMVKLGEGYRELHRGPAMVAAVQQPDGRARGVHRTWLDLDQPLGKAVLAHPETGAALDAKKAWGSKKGGAIRLATPEVPWTLMVVAEGIETTLTALAAARAAGWAGGAACWALADLGNISGRMQAGPGLKFAGLPDMGDHEAWVPPPWVRRLVVVMDGDSEPHLTRARCLAGARRAMARVPGLAAEIARCPAGTDLNDLLMEDVDG